MLSALAPVFPDGPIDITFSLTAGEQITSTQLKGYSTNSGFGVIGSVNPTQVRGPTGIVDMVTWFFASGSGRMIVSVAVPIVLYWDAVELWIDGVLQTVCTGVGPGDYFSAAGGTPVSPFVATVTYDIRLRFYKV